MSVLSARLPILATVKAAYGDVFADFPATLRALSLMLALLLLFTELPMLFLSGYAEKNILPGLEQQQAQLAAGIDPGSLMPKGTVDPKLLILASVAAVYTLQMIFLFRFTLGWYRQLLLGENKGEVVKLRLGKPEWQLMLTSVKAGFAFMPFVFIAMMILTAAYPDGDVKVAAAFDIWPWLGGLLLCVLYVQARLALAYPICAMGEHTTSVRQSWRLTQRQSLRIAAGNLLIELPFIAAMVGVVYALSWLLALVIHPETLMQNNIADILVRILFKAIAEFFILLIIAGISAYHARCYAYLVRSSSSSTVH